MSSELDFEMESKKSVKAAKSVGIMDEGFGNGNRPIDNDQENEKTEEERLFEQVLSIPLILKEILKQLDMKDLLITSLVNKYWNFFSREILREDKNCLAVVPRQNSCRNLKELITLLGNSETVPFDGISLTSPGNLQGHLCTHVYRSEILSNILGKIEIRRLSVDLNQNYDCFIAFECIREILMGRASSLKRLRVDLPWSTGQTFSEFIDLELQGQWLPNVRILEFSYEADLINSMPEIMVKELVEASPQLQKLYGPIDAKFLEFILPLRARVVKHFDFRPRVATLRNCLAFSLENPQLEKFSFSTSEEDRQDGIFCEWEESHQTEVSMVVKQLLKSSEDSLKKLALDHSDLILLTHRWNIPVLKKLNHLSLMYSNAIDVTEDRYTLCKIDWAYYFPNLKEVCVTDQWFTYLENDFYICDAFRESNAHFVCESVAKFCWIWSENFANAGKLQMFKYIFPNVKEFYLKDSMEFVPIVNQLWTAWTDLEAIYIESIELRSSMSSSDSVFLGISREEAAYLVENVEDLESMEIVSTRPCIFNLRKLKKLVINVTHGEMMSCADIPFDRLFLLSRLACQCAFARVPGLVVEIYRDICNPSLNCDLAFDHIQPFVKCVDHVCNNFVSF